MTIIARTFGSSPKIRELILVGGNGQDPMDGKINARADWKPSREYHHERHGHTKFVLGF